MKNDTLRYFRNANSENSLVPISSNEFKMLGISANLIAKFDLDKNGNKTITVSINDGAPSTFEYFEPILDSKKYIRDYTGRFYSPELESIFNVLIKDENLIGHHGRHGDFPMQMLKIDVLEIPGFAIIKFERKKDNKISGIRISNGRARNVWFEKQN
ncbi:MAG: hypothetical protein WA839_14955 [Flavobacteriaceae bacterium]